MTSRETIVVSSFVVHPTMPSEPGVGWQFLLATLEYADTADMDVVLVTNRRSEIACRNEVPEKFARRLTLVAIDIPRSPTFFRWHEPKYTRVEHEIWVRLAGRRMRTIARQKTVVYAHHVVFATELLSTPITRMHAGVFKVWGPIGAGGVAALFLVRPRSIRSAAQYLMQAVRDAVIILPARYTARRCDLVLAQNEALRGVLATIDTPVRLFPNVVVPLSAHAEVDGANAVNEDSGTGLNILCVGHLIARKRIDIAIDALIDPKLATATLHIVGQTTTAVAANLRAQCVRLGLEARVVFHGSVDRREVLAMMSRADVLLHPSGREGASGVVGEATSHGLPVVCFEGTGAASVLHHAGTSGVVIDGTARTSRAEVADAVCRAAIMPRKMSSMWTRSRLVDLAAQLHRDGLAHRAHGAVGVS